MKKNQDEVNKISIKEICKYAAAIVITVIPILAALFAVDSYFERKISNQINSPEYVEKISKNLRPFLLFNLKSNIVYDYGALKYIDKIEVVVPSEKKIFDEPIVIVIHPKIYFKNEPFLECLSSMWHEKKAMRIDNKNWKYSIKIHSYNSIRDFNQTLFRLEILK